MTSRWRSPRHRLSLQCPVLSTWFSGMPSVLLSLLNEEGLDQSALTKYIAG